MSGKHTRYKGGILDQLGYLHTPENIRQQIQKLKFLRNQVALSSKPAAYRAVKAYDLAITERELLLRKVCSLLHQTEPALSKPHN